MPPSAFRPIIYRNPQARILPPVTQAQPAPLLRRLILAAALTLALIVAQPAIRLVITGDFAGSASTYGWQEDSPATIALLNLHALATGAPCCAPLTD